MKPCNPSVANGSVISSEQSGDPRFLQEIVFLEKTISEGV
jgi:hypothetical protein